MFKGYLTTQLSVQKQQIQSTFKIDKDAANLKYKGNKKQFEANAQLEEILDQIKGESKEPEKVKELVDHGKQIIKRRQG